MGGRPFREPTQVFTPDPCPPERGQTRVKNGFIILEIGVNHMETISRPSVGLVSRQLGLVWVS